MLTRSDSYLVGPMTYTLALFGGRRGQTVLITSLQNTRQIQLAVKYYRTIKLLAVIGAYVLQLFDH